MEYTEFYVPSEHLSSDFNCDNWSEFGQIVAVGYRHKERINNLSFLENRTENTDVSEKIWNIYDFDPENEKIKKLQTINSKFMPKLTTFTGLHTYKKIFGDRIDDFNILVDKEFSSPMLQNLIEQGINFTLVLDSSLADFFTNLAYVAARKEVEVRVKCLDNEELEDLSIPNYTYLKLAKSHRVNFRLIK